MQITIEAMGEQKTGKYGPYFGVKAGGVWYNIQGERRDLKGKTFEAEIKDSGKFKWAKLGTEVISNGRGSNGAMTWWDYSRMAKLAHELAVELEPDETGAANHFNDRAQARAAIMNTCLIAVSNGKVAVLEDEETPPIPTDDTPF